MTYSSRENWPVLWSVGARLRFKRNGELHPQFQYLRGTPVLVLEGVRDFREVNRGVRQWVYAFAGNCAAHRIGWARPDQLEPIPYEEDAGSGRASKQKYEPDNSRELYPVGECRIGCPSNTELR